MKSSRSLYLALIAVLIGAIVGVLFFRTYGTTTLLLVRHAEKLDDSANTNLSIDGFLRADGLVRAVQKYQIAGIYSTNFCRTAQTVLPLAELRSLPINVQQISAAGGLEGCDPDIEVPVNALPAELNDLSAYVAHLLARHAGETVLIVGHSNTTPALANALGDGMYELDQLGHDEYDKLFVIKRPRFWGEPSLLTLQYGK